MPLPMVCYVPLGAEATTPILTRGTLINVSKNLKTDIQKGRTRLQSAKNFTFKTQWGTGGLNALFANPMISGHDAIRKKEGHTSEARSS